MNRCVFCLFAVLSLVMTGCTSVSSPVPPARSVALPEKASITSETVSRNTPLAAGPGVLNTITVWTIKQGPFGCNNPAPGILPGQNCKTERYYTLPSEITPDYILCKTETTVHKMDAYTDSFFEFKSGTGQGVFHWLTNATTYQFSGGQEVLVTWVHRLIPASSSGWAGPQLQCDFKTTETRKP